MPCAARINRAPAPPLLVLRHVRRDLQITTLGHEVDRVEALVPAVTRFPSGICSNITNAASRPAVPLASNTSVFTISPFRFPTSRFLASLAFSQFKREVEKELTGRETEPWEIIYFKLYKSQIPVIEQALETAALMLGTDKSRGYCLEMICADFLAGANLDNGNPEILLQSVARLFKFLPREQRQAFLCQAAERIAS